MMLNQCLTEKWDHIMHLQTYSQGKLKIPLHATKNYSLLLYFPRAHPTSLRYCASRLQEVQWQKGLLPVNLREKMKTFAVAFRHSIKKDEASALNFYNQIICSNQSIQKSIATFLCSFLYDIRYSSFENDVFNYEDHSVLYLHNFYVTIF